MGKPKMPNTPPPPAPAPQPVDASVIDARRRQKKLMLLNYGRQSTVLASAAQPLAPAATLGK